MNLFLILLTALSTDTGLAVRSPEFKKDDLIPSKYTCDGKNINPPLTIEGIPSDTKSLAIIVEDPDAPDGTVDHWLVWNIPPQDTIKENSAPGVQGENVRKKNNYTGPCPPDGTHHYYFMVFALDTKLDLKAGANKKALENAMKGHVLSQGRLICVYKRQRTVSEK